jgi:hypothetical protein
MIRIDPKEPVSDIIWDTAETLVHRATLMENKAESERLLRAPSQHKSLHRLKSMEGGLRNNPTQLADEKKCTTNSVGYLTLYLHTWLRNSCFTCDGSSTIQDFPLLFNIGMVIQPY